MGVMIVISWRFTRLTQRQTISRWEKLASIGIKRLWLDFTRKSKLPRHGLENSENLLVLLW